MTDARFLCDGVPRIDNYKTILENLDFLELEDFSHKFINRNRHLLSKYRWSKDPLHQWSRLWEYTYVYQRIKAFTEQAHNKNLAILDAGAGWGFFPYFLKQKFGNIGLKCCDSDRGLDYLYKSAERGILSVDICQLQAVTYPDNYFDIIYCISVLEHCKDYDKIINEFNRILRPGGILILTFDISLDNEKEIAINKVEGLISALESTFETKKKFDLRDLDDYDIVTTAYIKWKNPTAMPWKVTPLMALYYFFRTGKLAKDFYLLAFFCNVYQKPKK